ncbi:MAG: RHS repeat-associated core domain-containing protein [Acidobacteriota bacterium]
MVEGTGGTEYIYNVDRELEQIIRPDGSAIAFAYDVGGRLQSVVAPDGSRTFGYDHEGHLASITGAQVGLSYVYDGSTPVEASWLGDVTGSVIWSYDSDTRLGGESVAGSEVLFTYDDDGLLERAGALQLVRGADGIVDYVRVNASTETFQVNGHGELDSLLQQDVHPVTGVPRTLMTMAYSRDVTGRITGVTESTAGTETSIGYHYDVSGRLDQVTYPSAIVNYAYDRNGNRVAREAVTTAGTTVETASYDAQDRLLNYEGTQYTYTPNGDLLTKTDPTGTTHYTYDALGNLLKVVLPSGVPIDYLIDAQNRRVGRKLSGVITHRWLYSDQLRIIAELDATGAVSKRFVYGSRTNIPDYMVAGGVTYRIYSDHLGSPRAVVNLTTGVVVQAMRFDEFGYVLSDTNPGFIPFGFAGGLYDVATGLVRFGARDYDAQTGRWTAKDPIGFAGGDSNLYGYVTNDPINATDPSGLTWRSNWNFFSDWVMGSGGSVRSYGPNAAESQEMRQSAGAARMREVFYDNNCRSINRLSYGTGRAYWDTVANPITADWSSTGAQVGGFAGASATNNGNGTATFNVPNVAGTHSFFLHAVPNRSGNGMMSNIYQDFTWTEAIPQGCGCP